MSSQMNSQMNSQIKKSIHKILTKWNIFAYDYNYDVLSSFLIEYVLQVPHIKRHRLYALLNKFLKKQKKETKNPENPENPEDNIFNMFGDRPAATVATVAKIENLSIIKEWKKEAIRLKSEVTRKQKNKAKFHANPDSCTVCHSWKCVCVPIEFGDGYEKEHEVERIKNWSKKVDEWRKSRQ
jgi:hypothetical protein